MEENQVSFSRQEGLQKAESGGNKIFWLLIPIVLAVLVGGGFFFLNSRQKSGEILTISPTPVITFAPTPTSTPIPTPEVTPTSTSKPTITPTKKPTPTPQKVATTAAELKRQAISIQILNGSGTVGVAQKAADYLASFSYTIAATGNADNYNFAETEIKTKTEANLTLLQADLVGQYTIGTASATLESSSPYDAVVTVGKK